MKKSVTEETLIVCEPIKDLMVGSSAFKGKINLSDAALEEDVPYF